MSLTDLLRWSGRTRKSGVLEVERNKIRKRIQFERGRIVSCSTQDPALLLGQFLISRGKLSRGQLKDALARQERSGETLGAILSEMGILSSDELDREVQAKAEESLYGLFDWTDAAFRFNEHALLDGHAIAIDVEVEEIVENGQRRHDELERIRGVFASSGVVLRRTDKQTPPEIRGSGMASRILEGIDGERSIAEVLLHAHASEYLVLRFLFMLFRRGVVAIRDDRRAEAGATLLDPPSAAVEWEPEEPSAKLAASAEDSSPSYPDLTSGIRRFEELTERGEYDGALDAISACYRAHPDDDYLRHLVLQAEAAYIQAARAGVLEPSRIPMPLRGPDEAPAGLQPTERFLLGLLDGRTDIKSMVWTAPIREVDLFRALQHLHERRLIDLRDADGIPQEVDPDAVLWAEAEA